MDLGTITSRHLVPYVSVSLVSPVFVLCACRSASLVCVVIVYVFLVCWFPCVSMLPASPISRVLPISTAPRMYLGSCLLLLSHHFVYIIFLYPFSSLVLLPPWASSHHSSRISSSLLLSFSSRNFFCHSVDCFSLSEASEQGGFLETYLILVTLSGHRCRRAPCRNSARGFDCWWLPGYDRAFW